MFVRREEENDHEIVWRECSKELQGTE